MGNRSGYDKSTGHDVTWLGVSESIPNVLRCFLKKWTKAAKKCTDFEPSWYVKYAGIVFRYKNIWYRMSPGSIGIRNETLGRYACGVDDELFEWLAGGMEKDLVQLGAEDVFYTGMMD